MPKLFGSDEVTITSDIAKNGFLGLFLRWWPQ